MDEMADPVIFGSPPCEITMVQDEVNCCGPSIGTSNGNWSGHARWIISLSPIMVQPISRLSPVEEHARELNRKYRDSMCDES